jgi:hypothetical protein
MLALARCADPSAVVTQLHLARGCILQKHSAAISAFRESNPAYGKTCCRHGHAGTQKGRKYTVATNCITFFVSGFRCATCYERK